MYTTPHTPSTGVIYPSMENTVTPGCFQEDDRYTRGGYNNNSINNSEQAHIHHGHKSREVMFSPRQPAPQSSYPMQYPNGRYEGGGPPFHHEGGHQQVYNEVHAHPQGQAHPQPQVQAYQERQEAPQYYEYNNAANNPNHSHGNSHTHNFRYEGIGEGYDPGYNSSSSNPNMNPGYEREGHSQPHPHYYNGHNNSQPVYKSEYDSHHGNSHMRPPVQAQTQNSQVIFRSNDHVRGSVVSCPPNSNSTDKHNTDIHSFVTTDQNEHQDHRQYNPHNQHSHGAGPPIKPVAHRPRSPYDGAPFFEYARESDAIRMVSPARRSKMIQPNSNPNPHHNQVQGHRRQFSDSSFDMNMPPMHSSPYCYPPSSPMWHPNSNNAPPSTHYPRNPHDDSSPNHTPNARPQIPLVLTNSFEQQQEYSHVIYPATQPTCQSIGDVNMDDVLCGRGGGTNSQVGNRKFRKLVQDYQPEYLVARRKSKPQIAKRIVQIIRRNGGRFLKKHEESGFLFEVGDERAESKTSQALREGLDVRATIGKKTGSSKDEDDEEEGRNTPVTKNNKRDREDGDDTNGEGPIVKKEWSDFTPPRAKQKTEDEDDVAAAAVPREEDTSPGNKKVKTEGDDPDKLWTSV